jgi:GT2 family glycosyltransferase
VVRKALFFSMGQLRPEFDGAQDYDLMLRISRLTGNIAHISRPLYSWRAVAGSAAAVVDAKPYALAAGLRALQDHVAQKYMGARAEPGRLTGTFRVRRMIPPGLKVTLIILTNNQTANLPGRGMVNLLENFIRSIRQKTTYPLYEIMVVDNASLRDSQVKALKADGIEVVDYGRHDQFNYAAKANFAVRAARTEMLVLLNDDMEVISSGWLHALLEFAVDPEIGAVGARLLRADDTVQHVGAVIGLHEGVGHIYHNAQHDFIGYNGFTHIIRNFSAVTGACLATRKTVVMNAGGFDEQFAIDYNDIDLCLKLRRAGYRIVYTPYAELYHFERLSIPQKQQNPDERNCFRARWKNLMENDPYYNINLTRTSLDYARAD